jgi:hypothetical protein
MVPQRYFNLDISSSTILSFDSKSDQMEKDLWDT